MVKREDIEGIIKGYKLDISTVVEKEESGDEPFSITFVLGSNEGYFVAVTSGKISYYMRVHDKSEALKVLGCMLILVPNN